MTSARRPHDQYPRPVSRSASAFHPFRPIAGRLTRLCCALLPALAAGATAAVTIQVNAAAGRIPISPCIYGKNHGISDNSGQPTADSIINLYRDAGVKILRLGGGNNQTKYNWRAKLSSHPDWFNNVYAHDWDFSAKEVQTRLPGVAGLFSFQLIGKVAANTGNNFGDWTWYQQHNSYPPVGWNLAGGGTFTFANNTYTMGAQGNPDLYLRTWPADSTVAILDSWFKAGGAGLDTNRFRYWNMDNEPEIWAGTHDDVIKDTTAAAFEDYFARYVAVAKAARVKWPGVQLVGPVTANEWQWWTFNGHTWKIGAAAVSAMEYFIYRIAQEEKASGTRLLDVYDIHFYPGYDDASKLPDYLALHRLYYDTTYKWPGSNGIHMVDGKWGTPVPNYIFLRIVRWMEQYLGAGRGRVACSEFGAAGVDGSAGAHAVGYASTLGTWADNGFELFTPWDWYPGWYETLHLFTTCAKSTRVTSTSTMDSVVSAYSSVNAKGDSLTVILVNRDRNNAQSATVGFSNFATTAASVQTRQLASLSGETFKSAAQNALVTGSVTIAAGLCTISLPKMSVTAVLLASSGAATRPGQTGGRKPSSGARVQQHGSQLMLHDAGGVGRAELLDMKGSASRVWEMRGTADVQLPLQNVGTGMHFVRLAGDDRATVVVVTGAR